MALSMFLYPFSLRMGSSSGNIEQWLAEARLVPAQDPCFSTIGTLIDTTGKGM